MVLQRSIVGSFLAGFVAALLGAVAVAQEAESTAQPLATPGEIRAGLRLGGGGVSLSADGGWLALSTSKGGAFVNLQSGKMANAGRFARAETWDIVRATPVSAWSPVASRLAFLLFRESKWHLSIWNPADGSVRELLVNPHKHYMQGPPVWSADGKTIYVLVNQHLPWPKSHPDDDDPPTISDNVEIAATAPYIIDVKRPPRFEKEHPQAYAEGARSIVIAVDAATGRTGLLLKGNDITAFYPSPDGRWLAVTQGKRGLPGKQSHWSRQVYTDVYLAPVTAVANLPAIDLESFDDRRAGWSDYTGKRLQPVLADVHLNSTELLAPPDFEGNNGNALLSWSPDASRFAFATSGRAASGDVFMYELASKQLRNLTEGVALDGIEKQLGYGEHYTRRYLSKRFGGLFPPLWLPDGTALAAVGGGDAWLVPVAPGEAPRKLTAQLSQEARRIVPLRDSGVAVSDAEGRIAIIAKDRDTRMDGVWKVDAKNPPLKLADARGWINLTVTTDSKGSQLVYTAQGRSSPRNAYRLSLQTPGEPTAVTDYQRELTERQFPQTRELKWRTANGHPAYGLLYLPANVEPGKKLPLVFHAQPAAVSSVLDSRAQQGLNFLNDELHGLLSDGFAVLHADLPMSDEGIYEQPLSQAVDAVNRAVDAAIATGAIDETRMALSGAGYGGFVVQAVVTRTDRFKAAASIGGVANWMHDYMGGSPRRGSVRYHESGPGRLGKPLWEEPQRYLENSPLLHFPQIKTPLLLIHGDEDRDAPMNESRESFRSLERLEKTVVFARYRRMASEPWPDAMKRVQGWFREHLLGEKPSSHIAEQPSTIFGGGVQQSGAASRSR